MLRLADLVHFDGYWWVLVGTSGDGEVGPEHVPFRRVGPVE